MNNLLTSSKKFTNLMPPVSNFLEQNYERIRQSILDIDDSYNNDWDILAELIQNSVDAIRKSERTDGKIEIRVDCQTQSLTIKDNGVGIETGKLPNLLSLFGTDKRGDEKSIGEKGVGLKFAIFSTNDFYLKTATETTASYAKVKGAFNWKRNTDDNFLPLEHDEIEKDFEGTEVILNNIPECPLFTLDLVKLKFVLRTKTAIGNTKTIWEPNDINISVTLNYIDADGKEHIEKSIPFRYFLPIEGVSENDKINLDDYYDYIKDDKTDQQKRLKLKSKIVYKSTTIDLLTRKINAWICLVPSRATWDILSISENLGTEENLKDEKFLELFSYSIFQAGIFTSVKGMPTGIRVEHPITGSAGTWGQIFMLFEDKKLKFDIGRKSIHGKTAKRYQEKAREIFNEFRNAILKYVSGDISPEPPSWSKDEIFNEIDDLIDLPYFPKSTKVKKTPRDQEATVAALFFEAIGNGRIKKIIPLIAGYKNKYDLYALWEGKKIVVEFKSHLYKILNDFNDETKLFDEVDCVVCWDVSEVDIQEFKNVGIALDKIAPPTKLNPTASQFPHATHILRLSGFVKPVFVIDMKVILETEIIPQ